MFGGVALPSPARSSEAHRSLDVEALHSVATAETFDHSILDRTSSPPVGEDVSNDGSFGAPYELPSRGICDRLMRFYLDLADWIHHPIHLPTLLATYNQLWDTDGRKQRLPSRWLALLYAVLCLGAHFGDESPDYVEALYRVGRRGHHHTDG